MESFLAQSPQCIEKYNNAIDSGVISEMIFEPKSTAGKMVDSLFENMEKVLTKIRNDYSKPLTLDDLAEEAQLNKQYFCRAFRQATGKTPIDYLNYYRIECAAEQLSLSYVSITEIALSCGFNDLSYFNRLFKRSKGVTPSNYRKRFR